MIETLLQALCASGGLFLIGVFVFSICKIAARPTPQIEQMENEPPVDIGAEGYGSEYAQPTPRKVTLTPAQEHWERTGERVYDIHGRVVAPEKTDFVHAKRGK